MASACRTRVRRQPVLLALLVAFVMGHPATATADQVTSKGDVLRGTVVALTRSGVVFETEYAKEKLSIAYPDIEDIKTDGSYLLLYGEDGERMGRLVGISDGKLLIGESAATATAVELVAIESGWPTDAGELSLIDRLHSRWRHWEGAFDLGFALTQASVDTSALAIGLSANRRKKPTRLLLGAGYRYGTEKREDEDRRVIEDGAKGGARLEYDLTPRVFAFGSGDAQYDAIERLSLRAIPKLGLGYKVYESKTALLQVEAGGAWIFEKFFGGDTNDFFGVAFGARAEKELAYESTFEWQMDYLPAVDDFTGDYLLRTEAALLVPMFDPLSFKLGVLDEYDSTPAKGADRNKFATIAGISVAF